MLNMSKEEFEKFCYEAYKLDWMIDHGCTIDEMLSIMKKIAVEMATNGTVDSDMNVAFDDIVSYFEERGFNGELFVCFDEFLKNEYKSEPYMGNVLRNNYGQDYVDTYKKFVHGVVGNVWVVEAIDWEKHFVISRMTFDSYNEANKEYNACLKDFPNCTIYITTQPVYEKILDI